MPIRHILVALSGDADSSDASHCALGLTKRFSAHVTGVDTVSDEPIYPNISIAAVSSAYHVELTKTYELIKEQFRSNARDAFEKSRTFHGVPVKEMPDRIAGASASWSSSTSFKGDPILQLGRLSDLIVLEQRVDNQNTVAHFNVTESALFTARRPVLLVPPGHSDIGVRSAIAWDGSAEATDAIIRALPFLAESKEVDIIQVGGVRPKATRMPDLNNYLGWHGIVGRMHEVEDKPRSTGKILLQECERINAQLLIMGAYSRSPLRETIFGGVTQHILENAVIPVLLVH